MFRTTFNVPFELRKAGGTDHINISGVTKQGGPLSPFTYISVLNSQPWPQLDFRFSPCQKHLLISLTVADQLSVSLSMVEAIDDSLLFQHFP